MDIMTIQLQILATTSNPFARTGGSHTHPFIPHHLLITCCMPRTVLDKGTQAEWVLISGLSLL